MAEPPSTPDASLPTQDPEMPRSSAKKRARPSDFEVKQETDESPALENCGTPPMSAKRQRTSNHHQTPKNEASKPEAEVAAQRASPSSSPCPHGPLVILSPRSSSQEEVVEDNAKDEPEPQDNPQVPKDKSADNSPSHSATADDTSTTRNDDGGHDSDDNGPRATTSPDSPITILPPRREQQILDFLLASEDLRQGALSMMPKPWELHFKGYPIPPTLFYTHDPAIEFSIRPKIYAHTEKLEFIGAKALLAIWKMHSRVQDIRQKIYEMSRQHEAKDPQEILTICLNLRRDISKRLRAVLQYAHDWSQQDGNLVSFGDSLPPNVAIIDVDNTGPDENDEDDDDTAAEVAVTQVRNQMTALSDRWRAWAEANLQAKVDDDGQIAELPQLPVLYAFVVVEHRIMITHMDPADPARKLNLATELSTAGHVNPQWNALAIMGTMCWSRDRLMLFARSLGLQPVVQGPDSDPDA